MIDNRQNSQNRVGIVSIDSEFNFPNVQLRQVPGDVLGLNDETGNQSFCRKKLFSFLKSSRADAQGIAVLKKGDTVCTANVDQASLLNSQFQSVFSDHH